jgi:hypothetical protein
VAISITFLAEFGTANVEIHVYRGGVKFLCDCEGQPNLQPTISNKCKITRYFPVTVMRLIALELDGREAPQGCTFEADNLPPRHEQSCLTFSLITNFCLSWPWLNRLVLHHLRCSYLNPASRFFLLTCSHRHCPEDYTPELREENTKRKAVPWSLLQTCLRRFLELRVKQQSDAVHHQTFRKWRIGVRGFERKCW